MISGRISLQPKGFGGYPGTFWRAKRLDFSSRCFSPVMKCKDLEVFDETMRGVEHCVLDNMQHVESLSTLVHARNLVSLSLENSTVTDAGLIEVLQTCSNLENLNVQGCMFLRGEWIESLKYTPRIRVLKMGGCGMDVTTYWNTGMLLESLETLVIMGNIVSDDCISAIIHGCKNTLVYVDVRKCSDVTYQSLYALSASCRRIQTLKVGPLFHCSLEDVWQAIPRFKALDALEIYGHVDRPSRSLADILDRDLWHMPPLKKLSLMDTHYDWDTMKALSIACGQTLEYLNLGQARPGDDFLLMSSSYMRCTSWNSFSEYTDVYFPKLVCLKAVHSLLHIHGMNALIQSSPSLEVLDLSGCPCLKRPRARRRMNAHGISYGSEIDRFSRALGSLSRLERLYLQNAQIDDEHLKHIGDLTELKVVDLRDNPGITDATMEHIASWKKMTMMNILNTSIGSRGLRLLTNRVSSHMKEVHVSGNMCHLSADVLEFVSQFPEVRVLHFKDIQDMDDDILERLVGVCPCITDLSLAGCRSISPHALCSVVQLRNLQKLDISRLRDTVTDENVQYILAHTCLSEIRVSGAELSQTSLDTLLASRLLHYIDISFCFGIGTDDACAMAIEKSGSPVKIRLPQGTTRLGLSDPGARPSAQRSLVF